jgi:hypothetical protein
MSFFDEVAKETMGKQRHPKWHRDQTYHLKIDNYEPVFQTRSSGTATVVEFTVLGSSCREHPKGQKLSLLIFHNSDSAKGNLSKILRAALNVQNTPEGTLYYEAHIQPHAATYAQDARYFVGKEITVTTETRISKEKKKEYVFFNAEPLRKGADGQPEPLAERETKPVLKGDVEPAPQAAPPPGYGYPSAPPPGYGYPPPGYPAAPPPGYGYPAAPPAQAAPAPQAPGYGYPPPGYPAAPPPGYKPPGT